MTFRHPLRNDSNGKRGLKVRRGLGTTDADEADRLVDQLNLLLSDRGWWSIDRRHEAERKFDSAIVSAFFDHMEVGRMDFVELRESYIPLPTRGDGYARVMLVGTTGAGKTTLLRNLIGSDHRRDRFPSTAPGRTTTADIEIITADGQFEAAVTFMREHEIRIHVSDCLEAACLAYIEGAEDKEIANKLLSHREQRFRLSYTLGAWNMEASSSEPDFSFDFEEVEDELPEGDSVTTDERDENNRRLREYVSSVKEAASAVEDATAANLGPLADIDKADDRDAWIALLSENILANEQFESLLRDIMDDIERRFNLIDSGEFSREGAKGWPTLWYYEDDNRDTFLKQVRWFSSNHKGQFGRLLTPLVNGVRVKGAFYPSFDLGRVTRLVLIDGQGLGHTAKSVSSISTHITSRFSEVDVVMLVDNAKQPMQAAPLQLLRAIGDSGYADKLVLAFTHCDQVRGPNLSSFGDMKDHVMGTVGDAASSLRESLGDSLAKMLERQIGDNTFFLAGLNLSASRIPPVFTDEMRELLNRIESAQTSEESVPVVPQYNVARLDMAIRDAVDGFFEIWDGRLGIKYSSRYPKEHWTRIKALSRRLAYAWDIEYDDLMPVGDMATQLQSYISHLLDNPDGWTGEPKDQSERDAAINLMRQLVSAPIRKLANDRLCSQLSAWNTAYEFSGVGSSYSRAEEIDQIYNRAAPAIRSIAISEQTRIFRDAVQQIVLNAIEEYDRRSS